MSTGRCPHIDCEIGHYCDKASKNINGRCHSAKAAYYDEVINRLLRQRRNGVLSVTNAWNAGCYGDRCAEHRGGQGRTDNPAETSS
jgi:hypothetical protein